MAGIKVAVVIVTFNRLDMLKIALECYEKQTQKIEQLLVVDNNSTDDTVEYLKKWQMQKGKFKRRVVFLKENIGGAGGFGTGMDFFLDEINSGKLDVDWIMVADDDAFPESNAIEELGNYYCSLTESEQKSIAALTSVVVNSGKIHTAHRSIIERKFFRIKFVGAPISEYDNKAFEIDLLSYVGSMIKVNALKKIGTTKKELFIYGDDNEHSLRLKKFGRILCVTSSIYHHDTQGVEARSIGWHNYYNRRNQLYILKKYFPKRYFIFRVIKRYIMDASPISKYNTEEKKLFRTAYRDAITENLGKHPLYAPGFIIGKE